MKTLWLIVVSLFLTVSANAQFWAGPGDTLKIPLFLLDSVGNPAVVDSAADSVVVRVIKNYAANAGGSDTCYLHRGLMDASTNSSVHGGIKLTFGGRDIQMFNFLATASALTNSATTSGTYDIFVSTWDASLGLWNTKVYTFNYCYWNAATSTFAGLFDTMMVAFRYVYIRLDSATSKVGVGDNAIGAAEIAANAITSSEAPNLDVAITTRLAPTTAGRTLDVTATGEAGIDLDNTAGTLSAAEIPNLDSATSKVGIGDGAIGYNEITDTGAQRVVNLNWDEVLSGATHNITNSSGRKLRTFQDNGVYQDAAVWIDTINGTAGTTTFTNGTYLAPVNTLADARTIALADPKLYRFSIANGSSITLANGYTNYDFFGDRWFLSLGGQAISGVHVEGATVSGVAALSSPAPEFNNCLINSVTLPPSTLRDCGLGGTITVGSAGTYYIDACYAAVSPDHPAIDFGAGIGATTIHLRHYAGEINLQNVKTGDIFTFGGTGAVNIGANSTGGTVRMRGNIKLIDSSGGAVAIDDTARYAVDQNIGVNWADITNKTTTNNLSGTTIGTVTNNGDKSGYSLTTPPLTASDTDDIRNNIVTALGDSAAYSAKYKNMIANHSDSGATITVGNVGLAPGEYTKIADSVGTLGGTSNWSDAQRDSLMAWVLAGRDTSTAIHQKINIAADSINAISTWLNPTLDSMLYAQGFKAGARTTQGVSADCDTLHVKIGTTPWFKMLFYHVGGTAGARPDSTITVTE